MVSLRTADTLVIAAPLVIQVTAVLQAIADTPESQVTAEPLLTQVTVAYLVIVDIVA